MTTGPDDVLVRFGRWALAKVWFGVVLSGGYAVGRHFDWPRAFLTAAAVLGAVALALATSFLPIWTRQRPSGIPVADVGLRVMVWGGLTGSVIALLVGLPAVGMVAAALLLNTAARTFGDPFTPFLRRLRIASPVPPVWYTGRSRSPVDQSGCASMPPQGTRRQQCDTAGRAPARPAATPRSRPGAAAFAAGAGRSAGAVRAERRRSGSASRTT